MRGEPIPKLRLGLIAVGVLALSTAHGVAGTVFWTQDFEELDLGSVDNQGTTWSVNGGVDTADVVGTNAHSGNNSLVVNGWHWANPGSVSWWDDTPTMPHAGLLELSWWMYQVPDPTWRVLVEGWDGQTVAHIGIAHESPSTIDAYTAEGWVETMAIVPMETWREVCLQIDFSANPDIYRLRAGGGPWQPEDEWYTLGVDEQYLRRLTIQTSVDMPDVYFDDFVGVPEPATLSLLAVGGLLVARRRRTHA